jgi:plastocyanin
MISLSRLTFGILLAVSTTVTIGCSDSSNNNTPGAGGGGGGGTTGGGGSGGGIPFMAMIPCSMESSYVSTGTTIAFGGSDPGFNYAPKCLKVSAGATVTFNGDFAMHPLKGSTLRGTLTGNPIPTTALNTGTSMPFTFPTPGFYAYYCAFHGADDAEFMNGVIWVN